MFPRGHLGGDHRRRSRRRRHLFPSLSPRRCYCGFNEQLLHGHGLTDQIHEQHFPLELTHFDAWFLYLFKGSFRYYGAYFSLFENVFYLGQNLDWFLYCFIGYGQNPKGLMVKMYPFWSRIKSC